MIPMPSAARGRAWARAWHRDIGYLVAGLTIAYAVSGVAVNHVDDWNPKYAIERRTVAIGPLPPGDLAAMEAAVVARLAIDPAEVRGRHAPNARQFKLFLPEGGEVAVRIADGVGSLVRVQPRAGLYQFHQLHLNALKGAWTWVADAFALLLVVLAVTGVFLPRGRQGLWGRGGVLAAIGLLIPGLALWWLGG